MLARVGLAKLGLIKSPASRLVEDLAYRCQQLLDANWLRLKSVESSVHDALAVLGITDAVTAMTGVDRVTGSARS